MPLKKEQFTLIEDNLADAIDVDDSLGRSVPINMNFIDVGFLQKDTGCSLFGAAEATDDVHSLFNYKKKNGTSYFIRAKATKLQVYNTGTGVWDNLSPTYTAGAKFGFVVYNDDLYGCNGVENYFKWDGTTFTEYASAPKGNILEVYEDRIFVAGVTAQPLSIYYSDPAAPTTFDVASILKPLGTDFVTGLVNYYGVLLIFKTETIWKMSFVFDSVVSLYLPKLEVQSGTYGACSRKALIWVENDVWFFTGQEVRAIGFKDQQLGILGVNESVLSEPIKETLKLISTSNYSKVTVSYSNRRFYLSVPLSASYNDTMFVCHTLYKNNWTKFTSRIKANVSEMIEVDNVIYSTKSVAPYGVLKWNTALLNDNGVAIACEVFFKKIEDKDFNKFNIYRYLDYMFTNLEGTVTATIKEEANDLVTAKVKTFYIGEALEDEEGSIGEVPYGEALFGDSWGDTLLASPFTKKRISFLSKAQALTVGVSNSSIDETFTVAQYALWGTKEPRRLFKPSGIISIG
jgi:hypothetical protein